MMVSFHSFQGYHTYFIGFVKNHQIGNHIQDCLFGALEFGGAGRASISSILILARHGLVRVKD
jgi:hypothetical protein